MDKCINAQPNPDVGIECNIWYRVAKTPNPFRGIRVDYSFRHQAEFFIRNAPSAKGLKLFEIRATEIKV